MGPGRAEKFFLSFSALELSIFTLSLALTAFHHLYPTWPVANVVALSLAFGAVALLRLDSFFTGGALLTGLFLYDIWFVFGTKAVFGGESVMVSVAKNVEGPIAIRFPKDLTDSTSGMTMLGLGDIVLPGAMLALALRFDYHLALERISPPPTPRGRWPKPYFYSTLVAYVAGLVTTIVVMHTFKAAQPALLYLSPACVSAPVLCALAKGELKVRCSVRCDAPGRRRADLPLRAASPAQAFWAFDDGAEEERVRQEQVQIEREAKEAREFEKWFEEESRKVRQEEEMVRRALSGEGPQGKKGGRSGKSGAGTRGKKPAADGGNAGSPNPTGAGAPVNGGGRGKGKGKGKAPNGGSAGGANGAARGSPGPGRSTRAPNA